MSYLLGFVLVLFGLFVGCLMCAGGLLAALLGFG